jgi:hypothetical protein
LYVYNIIEIKHKSGLNHLLKEKCFQIGSHSNIQLLAIHSRLQNDHEFEVSLGYIARKAREEKKEGGKEKGRKEGNGKCKLRKTGYNLTIRQSSIQAKKHFRRPGAVAQAV